MTTFLIMSLVQLLHAPATELYDIPITVLDTWEITFASDVQDIALNYNGGPLAIRSNGDGKIYLASPSDCSYMGEIDLPDGIEGFGMAVDGDYPNPRYYVSSAVDSMICHSDGSDSWACFPDPAGAEGAGMDLKIMSGDSDLYRACSQSPHLFYGIDRDDYTWETWGLPGITGEVSGFMVHELMTLDDSPPTALITTTRYTHQFYFYWEDGPDYFLYGQEDCPLSVEESLGLAWLWNDVTVYWSWKGTDGNFYVSKLAIPIFGGIEEETAGAGSHLLLWAAANPARGSASLTVDLEAPSEAELTVFDLSGRPAAILHNGMLSEGPTTFCFDGPAGMYTAVLRTPEGPETLRFVITP